MRKTYNFIDLFSTKLEMNEAFKIVGDKLRSKLPAGTAKKNPEIKLVGS